MSRNSGTRRTREDSRGHDESAIEYRRTRKEPPGYGRTHRCAGSGPLGPGFNSRPPTNFEFRIGDFGRRRKSVGRREVTAVSQIFLELDRDSPVQVDCGVD